MKLIFLLLFLSTQMVIALEVDEKLTFRVLKLSETKKTILINRGLEDGLVVGDHAKFFLTYGVVARAVVEKASPSRSVWSIYRLVNATDLMADKVMRLKIATPLKLTEDASKMLVAEDVKLKAGIIRGDDRQYSYREMPSQDDNKMLNTSEMDYLRNDNVSDERLITESSTSSLSPAASVKGNWELLSFIHLFSLSAVTDDDVNGTQEASRSFTNFSIGIEKYFNRSNSFFSKFSVGFVIEKMTDSTSDDLGNEFEDNSLTFGPKIAYHFIHHPKTAQRITPYLNLGMGIGNTSWTDETGEINEASSNYFSVGLGFKYLTRWGLGFRSMLEYYRRGEEFPTEDEGNFTRIVSGPRLKLGLSYRF